MTKLNLTKEEKEIVITQLKGIIGFPAIWKKYINKEYKNPNEHTKKMVVEATKAWNEVMYKRSVLEKVVKALKEEI